MSSSSGRSSSIRDHHHCNYPSFSSTLLEEIYRSFDQEGENHSSDRIVMTSTMKKSSSCHLERERDDYHKLRANRFFAVDRWIENEKINLRRKSAPPPPHSDGRFGRCDDRRQINHSSSTSSSDSSSGIGGFSSSDTESLHGSAKPKKNSPALLKPIRTTAQNPAEFHRKIYSDDIPGKKKTSKEGNLQRRALKLYSDLKKVKQPISPGGKLASFLNSLFHSSASKKPNISSSSLFPSSNGLKVERESPATTSRSCLSKTPSSTGRFERRSVRFVDDEKRHERKCDVAKCDSSILAGDEEFKLQIKEKHRRVEEVAKELLKNYHHHNRKELTVNIVTDHSRRFDHNVVNNIRDFEEDEEEEDEDDDDVSCCSSDLFELENLLEIGIVDRYHEELPVYETTHVNTNRAIANRFIL